MAEVVVAPGLAVGDGPLQGVPVLVDQHLDGAQVALEVAGVGVGLGELGRGPGTASQSTDLRHVARCRRRIEARLSRSRLDHGDRRGPQGMPRAAGSLRARQRDRAETRCSAVAGIHRGRVEGGPLRPVQAVDEKERPLPALKPHPAGIRIEEARPYHRCTSLTLVRRLQPHGSRQRQSCPGAASADHELRGRLAAPLDWRPVAELVYEAMPTGPGPAEGAKPSGPYARWRVSGIHMPGAAEHDR